MIEELAEPITCIALFVLGCWRLWCGAEYLIDYGRRLRGWSNGLCGLTMMWFGLFGLRWGWLWLFR